METEDWGGVDDGDFVEGVEEAFDVELFGELVVVFVALCEEEFSVFVEEEVAHVFVDVGY